MYRTGTCVLREVAAQVERPVMLFSGGKDSAVLALLDRGRLLRARGGDRT